MNMLSYNGKCMHTYMDMYLHTNTHTNTHTQTHTYTHTHTYKHCNIVTVNNKSWREHYRREVQLIALMNSLNYKMNSARLRLD